MALEDVATKDGYDVQMQTNHLSHFLLTKELYPMLKRAQELRGEARVVNHSSGMRRHPNHPLQPEYLEKKGGQLGGNASGYLLNGPRWERYHQTKLANAVFTLALRDRFGESSGIKAVCAAPGAAATNLQLTAKDSGAVGEMGLLMTKYVSQSAEDGAMPILRACFDPDTNNGDFFEPSQYLASRGPAVKVEYDKLSSDVDSRTLLWEKSEEACGKFEI
jgi:NAD(P)-dependent dehydrogenase (short-subunit alcohol dehydrogenase family)